MSLLPALAKTTTHKKTKHGLPRTPYRTVATATVYNVLLRTCPVPPYIILPPPVSPFSPLAKANKPSCQINLHLSIAFAPGHGRARFLRGWRASRLIHEFALFLAAAGARVARVRAVVPRRVEIEALQALLIEIHKNAMRRDDKRVEGSVTRPRIQIAIMYKWEAEIYLNGHKKDG